jgi:3-isopropylmalate/(R)-2-methylmalate dehydratase small subunit
VEPFTTLTAIAAPLPWAGINTDDIYPGPAASPVIRAGKSEVMRDPAAMGPNAFAAHRWNDDLSPKSDFVLNRPPYDRAGILIARENFGCGSSREMAVWCLQAIGMRCVIAPSYGDIFYNNCFKNGVLPVRLSAEKVEHLLTLASDLSAPELTVDLTRCRVILPDGKEYRFEVSQYQRTSLLNGLDEVAATLARMSQIEAHERAYFAERPWLS